MHREQENLFSKIRILDLTRLLPGGFCTQIWADLGADVIKIEEKERGDYCRWDPPFVNGQSHYFLALNRNKRSLTLNLKTEEGKRIFIDLSRTADVIIENFRPGVMERLGLSYENLKHVNPRLVYCAISGYGQNSPNRDKAGHDINYLAESGYLDIAIKCGSGIPMLFLCDMAGSMFASQSISLALLNREQTGHGQYLDLSISDCFFSWMTLLVARSNALGRPLKADDLDHHGSSLCYNVYRTADDQFIAVGIIEEKYWVNFCGALDMNDLLKKQFVKRSQDPDAFTRLEKIIEGKTLQEWMIWANGRDLCFTPVKSINEVLSDPNMQARDLTYMMQVPGVGEVIQLAMPLKLSNTRVDGKNNPPPALGQHTAEILTAMGIDKEQIVRLKARNVV